MASNMRSIIEDEKKRIEAEQEAERKAKAKQDAEAAMKAQKEKFDQSIEELADRALEAMETRGKEDPITELLVNFLEVAIEMKDTMQTLEAINGAMQCVTDAIQFLDNALSMDQLMIESTMQHQYGFFARLKHKRQAKRAIRNHKNRMKQIVTNLEMKMEMAKSMVAIMKEFSVSMKKMSDKKKKKKGDGAAAAPSRAAAFLEERARAKGVNVSVAPAATEVKNDTDGGDDSGMVGGVNIFSHSN